MGTTNVNPITNMVVKRKASATWNPASVPGAVKLAGSVTWDPGTIADGNMEAKAVTVTGAAMGDYVIASHSADLVDNQLTASVTSTNTVTAVLSNSGATTEISSGTLRVSVFSAAVDANHVSVNTTVTGAELGDFVLVSFSLDTTDLILNASVTAADVVTTVLTNPTAAAVNIGEGTLRILIYDAQLG